MDRSLTAMPTCGFAACGTPWSHQLWGRFRRSRDVPAGMPHPGGCRCPVEAVKHEWAPSWCAALRRGAGHSRLTAGHRCPSCATVARAIQLAIKPGGGRVLPPVPPPLWWCRADGHVGPRSGAGVKAVRFHLAPGPPPFYPGGRIRPHVHYQQTPATLSG